MIIAFQRPLLLLLLLHRSEAWIVKLIRFEINVQPELNWRRRRRSKVMMMFLLPIVYLKRYQVESSVSQFTGLIAFKCISYDQLLISNYITKSHIKIDNGKAHSARYGPSIHPSISTKMWCWCGKIINFHFLIIIIKKVLKRAQRGVYFGGKARKSQKRCFLGWHNI